ncbi:unnamed protein product [Acanthoscelides obtectus]|uniref:Uncharacterized protein n=1 Tax=Acanthoscelides obtectus TaxID=200917 RepID=A0A9P0P3B1_ACAOB|nr:unnamed protein product [Acanthoscelides obtectus]CAK1648699.1 hypothetical protein AOBTE_LOCUS15828 [Acanthoscelides obtectus]
MIVRFNEFLSFLDDRNFGCCQVYYKNDSVSQSQPRTTRKSSTNQGRSKTRECRKFGTCLRCLKFRVEERGQGVLLACSQC